MITLCYGRRELGKSTLGYHVAQRKTTRVIFDPRKQFCTSPVITSESADVFDLLNEHAEIIYRPQFDVPKQFELLCDQIMAWLAENPDEPFALLVDEARFVETPDYIPPSLDWILRFTPREIVEIVFTAHRPGDVSVDIRAIADYWCIFHTTQEHDLKVIGERCGSEVAEIVDTLPDGEVLVWDDGHSTYRVERDRTKWFKDLKRCHVPAPNFVAA